MSVTESVKSWLWGLTKVITDFPEDDLVKDEPQDPNVEQSESGVPVPHRSRSSSAKVRSNSITPKPGSYRESVDEDLDLGITPLLREYVRNLCSHPVTWIEFPLEDQLHSLNKLKQFRVSGSDDFEPPIESSINSNSINDTEIFSMDGEEGGPAEPPVVSTPKISLPKFNINDFEYHLTPKQEAHAIRVLQEVPELSELRYRICPKELSEDRFWQIYFLLIGNKLGQVLEEDDSFELPATLSG